MGLFSRARRKAQGVFKDPPKALAFLDPGTFLTQKLFGGLLKKGRLFRRRKRK